MRLLVLCASVLSVALIMFGRGNAGSEAGNVPLPDNLQRLIDSGKMPSHPPGYASWQEYFGKNALTPDQLADPIGSGLIPPKPPAEYGFDSWAEMTRVTSEEGEKPGSPKNLPPDSDEEHGVVTESEP